MQKGCSADVQGRYIMDEQTSTPYLSQSLVENLKPCSGLDFINPLAGLFYSVSGCDEGDDHLYLYPASILISINTSSETMNNSGTYFVKYSNNTTIQQY